MVLAIAARLIFSLGISRVFLHDQPELQSTDQYHLIASNLLEGRGYAFGPGEQPTVERAPAYPAFLLGIFSVVGVNYAWVQFAQACLGAISCWLLFMLGRWVLSPVLGIVAALLFAVYPVSIEHSARLYSENLYYPLFLCFAYLLSRASAEGSPLKGMLAGLAWGAGLLTRGTLLPLPLVLPIGVMLSRLHRARSIWMRWAIPAVLVGILIVLPWTVRNYRLTGVVVPVSSVSWAGLYQGAEVASRMTNWVDLTQVDIDAAHHIDEIKAERFPVQGGPTPVDSVRRDQVAKDMILEQWRLYPMMAVKHALEGLLFAWFLAFGVKVRLVSLIVHIPLFLLFVTGTIQLARQNRPAFIRAWPALGLILFVNAFYAIAYPHIRYMAPAIVLSFLFSAYSLLEASEWVRGRMIGKNRDRMGAE
jgi:4-amino-4-deoxy-L-arabinose transferase-like glycosyltransferase